MLGYWNIFCIKSDNETNKVWIPIDNSSSGSKVSNYYRVSWITGIADLALASLEASI